MTKTLGLWVFAAAVGLGLFMGLSPSLLTRLDANNSSHSEDQALGEIVEIRGSTLKKKHAQEFFHGANAGQKIFPLDRILTGFDSEVLVSIGESFWLLPNSQVKIVRPQKQTEVHLISGSLKRIKKNSRTKFFVSGVPSSDLLIKRGSLSPLTSLPLADVTLEAVAVGPKPEKVAGINEKQIHQNFKLHQKFIEKCFIAHYSSAAGKTKSGKVWLKFKIGKKGKILEPNVSRSDYVDEKFHNCLENVVSRVQINGYNGPLAQVEFPINIKIPETQIE